MKKSEMLQRDVLDELAWDEAVDASTIGVLANAEGVVTLTGRVSSYSQKRQVEQAVKRISGVNAVANELEVPLEPSAECDDAEIAQSALAALRWTAELAKEPLKVTVDHGWIALEGQLGWHYQKRAAENAVRYLTGVKGVTNLIVLKSRLVPGDVKDRIEAAFQRSAQIDAEQITVETREGRVTLRGAVRTLAERDDAERAAWSTPGVTHLDNLITVRASTPIAF